MKTVKEPAYNYREVLAITQAVRVVARTLIQGQWHEGPFDPLPGETVLDTLERVAAAARHLQDKTKFAVYVENAEGLRANVPIEFGVPSNIREKLPTFRRPDPKKKK